MSVVVKDLGIATAYGYAVSKGFTGTEQEFAQLMASYGSVAQQAAASAAAAAQSADAASASASAASGVMADVDEAMETLEVLRDNAQAAASTATDSASAAVSSAQSAAGSATSAAASADSASTSATTAAASATAAGSSATSAASAMTAAQTAQGQAEIAQTGAVSAKTAAQAAQAAAETAQAAAESAIADMADDLAAVGAAQTALIEAKGEEVIESIPEDYSDLTNDVTSLKQDYNQLSETKADKNSDNPDMGAGYASQLVSSLRKSDSVPYNFRKVPYDSTLEDGSIVGASVAWNQLAKDFTSTNWLNESGVTASYADGVVTIATTVAGNGIMSDTTTVTKDHVYLVGITAKCSAAITLRFGLGFVVLSNDSFPASNYVNAVGIKKCTATASNRLALFGASATYTDLMAKDALFVDLTQMLGSTIADYVYSLETATAGAGVAWLKEHFPKQFGGGYQAYNAGEIKSISGLTEHKSVGFNQCDEVWEPGGLSEVTGSKTSNYTYKRSVNYCKCVGGATYFGHSAKGAQLVVYWYDANKTYVGFNVITNTTVVAPANAAYFLARVSLDYFPLAVGDICINISKPTGTPKNGDYVAYESHTYALDSTKTLRGILKLDGNNKLYADGDVYKADGTIRRRFGAVDLGTLTWTMFSTAGWFWADVADSKNKSNIERANALCSKYIVLPVTTTGGAPNVDTVDKSIAVGFNNQSRLYVHDSTYTDVATFKTAMSGQYLVYELATPTTEIASPYGNPQVIDPDGTESYVYTDGAFELPVGHASEYPVNVSGQLDDILDTPSANGTYTLRATVSNGTVSYEWVSA